MPLPDDFDDRLAELLRSVRELRQMATDYQDQLIRFARDVEQLATDISEHMDTEPDLFELGAQLSRDRERELRAKLARDDARDAERFDHELRGDTPGVYYPPEAYGGDDVPRMEGRYTDHELED